MNEQVRNILEQSTTKTSKIEQLLRLGLTRREIADLVTRGNYGFVYNVEKKMLEREGGVLLNRAATTLMDYTFTHKFGIEIEAYNCNMERLARELREAGIHVAVEGYNHTTRDHWKLVTDSSLQGNNTFELVSPILVGENGLKELETVCWVLDICNAKVNDRNDATRISEIGMSSYFENSLILCSSSNLQISSVSSFSAIIYPSNPCITTRFSSLV